MTDVKVYSQSRIAHHVGRYARSFPACLVSAATAGFLLLGLGLSGVSAWIIAPLCLFLLFSPLVALGYAPLHSAVRDYVMHKKGMVCVSDIPHNVARLVKDYQSIEDDTKTALLPVINELIDRSRGHDYFYHNMPRDVYTLYDETRSALNILEARQEMMKQSTPDTWLEEARAIKQQWTEGNKELNRMLKK